MRCQMFCLLATTGVGLLEGSLSVHSCVGGLVFVVGESPRVVPPYVASACSGQSVHFRLSRQWGSLHAPRHHCVLGAFKHLINRLAP